LNHGGLDMTLARVYSTTEVLMEIGETLYVITSDEFRKWLIKNHLTKKEIWLD